MFYQRLETLCWDHGMSVGDACRLAGLHRSTHSTWKKGMTPSKNSVQRLATVLCTTPEYLLDGVESSGEHPALSHEAQELLGVFGRLSSENKKLVFHFACELSGCEEEN